MNVRFRIIGSLASALVLALCASTNVVYAAAETTTKPISQAPLAPRDLTFWQWSDWSKEPTVLREFRPFGEDTGASSVAVGDLGTDGVDEIVVGTGFGVKPLVRILRGDGSEILHFAPFDDTMTQGVNVALGDLDGDGKAEIVAGTGPGAKTIIRVFAVDGTEKLYAGGFSPFETDFRGGVNVAVADLDGDGKDDIIASTGPKGGAHIKAWHGDGQLFSDFFAFDTKDLKEDGGLNLAAGDLDGDGKAEIVAAMAREAQAYVRVFTGAGSVTGVTKQAEFMAINHNFRGGLNLTVSDLDDNGAREIVVAPNGGGGPHVHAFGRFATATGTGSEYRLLGHFFSYDAHYLGGVLLSSGRFAAGEKPSLVTVPAQRTVDGRPHLTKYINVDLSEQRLRAFEYGKLVKTFLVTTGRPGFNTPEGDFSVLDKPLMVNYKWSYGPGNPENYDLGWVKWNLRFYPHIYIHNAPWRTQFGVRGSHGCVNVSPANAEWIYNWSDVGTPLTVQK